MLRQRAEEKDRRSLSPFVNATFKALYRILIQSLWVPSSVLRNHQRTSFLRNPLYVGMAQDQKSPLPCHLCPKAIKYTIIGIRHNFFFVTAVLEGMELTGEFPAWNDLTF